MAIELKGLQKVIPYKWRVQSFSKFKPEAIIVAYIDSRDVQNILDDVVGPENWQDDYRVVDGKLFAGIGIRIGSGDNGYWVWKWDTGTESQTEKDKGKVSDSFKRAAVKWGIGRFLYSLGIKKLNASEKKTTNNYPYCVDSNNKKIYDISKHVSKASTEKQANDIQDSNADKIADNVDDKPEIDKGEKPIDWDLMNAKQKAVYNRDNKTDFK